MAVELGLALALILVIEGSLYALFPDAMKQMMLKLIGLPVSTLRNVGLAAAILGVGLVWLILR